MNTLRREEKRREEAIQGFGFFLLVQYPSYEIEKLVFSHVVIGIELLQHLDQLVVQELQ